MTLLKPELAVSGDDEVRGNFVVREVGEARRSFPVETVLAEFDVRSKKVSITVDDRVVGLIPRGADNILEVEFFRAGRELSDEALLNLYADKGLIPADLYSMAAVNRGINGLWRERRNATVIQIPNDKNFYSLIFLEHKGLCLCVLKKSNRKWREDWWFGGIRPPVAV